MPRLPHVAGAETKMKLRKHGVGFAHAEQALRNPLAFTIEDPVYSWSSTPGAKSGRA